MASHDAACLSVLIAEALGAEGSDSRTLLPVSVLFKTAPEPATVQSGHG